MVFQAHGTRLTPLRRLFSHPIMPIARGERLRIVRVIAKPALKPYQGGEFAPGARLWATLKHQRTRSGMRRLLILSARILVSLALLYLALRGINFAAIQSRLSQITVGWIVVAVMITAVQIFIGALRWREISELCQAPLTDLQAFRYNMIGAFFNQTLPSSIGGDAMRLWLVNRTGAGWRAATYSLFTALALG